MGLTGKSCPQAAHLDLSPLQGEAVARGLPGRGLGRAGDGLALRAGERPIKKETEPTPGPIRSSSWCGSLPIQAMPVSLRKPEGPSSEPYTRRLRGDREKPVSGENMNV